jgi:hypothetical protein
LLLIFLGGLQHMACLWYVWAGQFTEVFASIGALAQYRQKRANTKKSGGVWEGVFVVVPNPTFFVDTWKLLSTAQGVSPTANRREVSV